MASEASGVLGVSTRTLGGAEPTQPSKIRASTGPIFVNMGPSGGGKTTMLETLNDSQYTPVCVLDIDHKAHVLTDRSDRDVFPINTWEELDAKVQALLAERLHPQYQTICFDGTTAIQMVLSYNKWKIRQQTDLMARRGAYGNSNLDMVDLAQSARLLAEAGLHIVFNIWAVLEKEESTGLTKATPDLTPMMLNRFLGLFDYVVYTEPAAPPAKPYPPVMYWGGSVTKATRAATSPESPLANMPERFYRPNWVHLFDSYHGQPWPTEEHNKP